MNSEAVLAALRRSWSKESAKQWSEDNPANGQCNATAILIHDLFGGEILKTPLSDGDHFYNRVDGVRFDFTASQFPGLIEYADITSDRREAAMGVTVTELQALRTTFQTELGFPGRSRT